MSHYRECSRCELFSGSKVSGRYAVESLIGEGTFGQVYRVRDQTDDSLKALKVLKLWCVEAVERERLLLRFEQEYETGKIASPYLVQTTGRGEIQGTPFIAMEYCPGGDLMHAAEAGAADLNQAARQVLAGLAALHASGKVHRDLKPENVLIKADGKCALTDFGIAGDRNKRLTERGFMGAPKEVLGTYAYMPPEQVNPRRGDATVLPTTDIFSYGVMMYQLLTGKLPFGQLNDEADLYHYVMRGKEGDWNRQPVPAQWLPMLESCMKPDFKQRAQSAAQVEAMLPGRAASIIETAHSLTGNGNCLQLRVMQGEEHGRIYHLDEIAQATGRRVVTMGRKDPETPNAIALLEQQSNYISRCHCTLEQDAKTGAWTLRDGQWDPRATTRWRVSTNGTYLDSSEVHQGGAKIAPGQIISVGDVKLRVETY